MGMAGGAYKGDMERQKLALQAQQIANQNAQAQQSAALRQRELDMREQARDDANALTNREMDIRERQQGIENGFRQQQLDASRVHQDRVDSLAERAAERADALLQQRFVQQSKVYGGYEQLAKQAKAQQQQRQAQGASAVASVMKLAMSSGGKDPKTGATGKGMVPMYALQALNRDMGFDGENQGFVSGGYTQNGDFFLQFARKDPQTGQMVTQPQVLKPMDQYRIMNQQQGIFNNEDRGHMASQLRQAGFRDDEIMLASGINQTQLEQMRKLASAKQVQGETLKEKLSALSLIKGFIDSNGEDIDEQTLAGLKSAYANGIQGIASQFASAQPKAGGNAPTLNADGTLTLPNGTTLRKDQEYTNPSNGYKYIWRGGDVKNFERIHQPQEGNQTMTDSEFSSRRAHQAQFYGKVRPGYELDGDDELDKPAATADTGGAPAAANPQGVEDGGKPQGGMAGGASGGPDGAAPQGGKRSDMEAMFNRLKEKGLIDDDMSLRQFIELNEEDEKNRAEDGGDGE